MIKIITQHTSWSPPLLLSLLEFLFGFFFFFAAFGCCLLESSSSFLSFVAVWFLSIKVHSLVTRLLIKAFFHHDVLYLLILSTTMVVLCPCVSNKPILWFFITLVVMLLSTQACRCRLQTAIGKMKFISILLPM